LETEIFETLKLSFFLSILPSFIAVLICSNFSFLQHENEKNCTNFRTNIFVFARAAPFAVDLRKKQGNDGKLPNSFERSNANVKLIYLAICFPVFRLAAAVFTQQQQPS
jgi:hypothetical protein